MCRRSIKEYGNIVIRRLRVHKGISWQPKHLHTLQATKNAITITKKMYMQQGVLIILEDSSRRCTSNRIYITNEISFLFSILTRGNTEDFVGVVFRVSLNVFSNYLFNT